LRFRLTNVLILLTLPTFAAALAPHLPPWHWLVDLPACFPVQAAALQLPMAAWLYVARRRRLAAAYLASGLMALLAVAPGWFAAREALGQDGTPLRVLSLNLLRGNHAAAPQALDVVRNYSPDVVFCSEVTPEWLQALRAGLADFPHRVEHADEGWFGVALFSKVPLTRSEVIPLGYAWAPALRTVLATPAGPVGLLGVHAPRPGTGNRCRERDRALAAIPAALEGLPGPQVVLGDCNATPWNGAFVELLAATGLQDGGGVGFQPTWPTNLPWALRVPIDHVLVRGGVKVAGTSVDGEFGSDHAPLFADLRVPLASPPGGR
jgi:endonuclease/exonuclease/phosphatase (EEP) superfamily protein YafD